MSSSEGRAGIVVFDCSLKTSYVGFFYSTHATRAVSSLLEMALLNLFKGMDAASSTGVSFASGYADQ